MPGILKLGCAAKSLRIMCPDNYSETLLIRTLRVRGGDSAYERGRDARRLA